jgi:hypothetical protein
VDDNDAPKKRKRRGLSLVFPFRYLTLPSEKSIEVEDDNDAPKKHRHRGSCFVFFCLVLILSPGLSEPSIEDEDSEDAPKKKCKDKDLFSAFNQYVYILSSYLQRRPLV